MKDIFDIERFNIIEDEENYYFFRALNMADNNDLEEQVIVDENGEYERIRTDRERYEEDSNNPVPKYSEESEISLEEVYDHIKMHYRKDTNCISLSSNANVSISYGRGFYKDKYVMIKLPKSEIGEKVINAGEYILQEIDKRIEEYISTIEADAEILEVIKEIEEAKTLEEIQRRIEQRYKANEELTKKEANVRRGIVYRSPISRISNYKALSEEQVLEKNKIMAKLTLLERRGAMEPLIDGTNTNNLLIQTVGNAFSSLELIHYGEIEKESIIDIPTEYIDIFSLLQQVQGREKQVSEIKREIIKYIEEKRELEISQEEKEIREYRVADNIRIEDMYELTRRQSRIWKSKQYSKKYVLFIKRKF